MITVETFDGSIANKKDCRFIKGDFYIKNKQCFLIDSVWYRVNSGFIIFDNETQGWVVVKNNPQLIKGIIGYDDAKKELILGHYSPNPYKNVDVFLNNGNRLSCRALNILPKNLFKEDPRNMSFVPVDHKTLAGIPNVVFASHGYPFTLQYCTKHYDDKMMDLFWGVRSQTHSKPKMNISSYVSEIGRYSFGFEFETNKGKIPNYKILDTGLIPLRDGSIAGIEFATIPLDGKQGVAILEEACESLQKYTTFTEQESLHLHLGNTQSTKKYIGCLYTICCILENEIYSMFPKYYAHTSKFKARGKDYNMPLRKELVAINPEETFDNIAFYLSAGKKYQGFGAEHPSDPEGQHKWGINERYHWVNFIPLLFGSNKTVEFRCHVPTHDTVKILNWLYICSAIVKYAEGVAKSNTNLSTLKSLSLKTILNDVYSYRLACYLIDYVNDRKNNRIQDESNGDCTGMTEIRSELNGKSPYRDII